MMIKSLEEEAKQHKQQNSSRRAEDKPQILAIQTSEKTYFP
jgi:hypothetical protein